MCKGRYGKYRMLIAQAIVESLTLLTADPHLARYEGPVRKV